MRILITDDERAIRRSMREILEFEGYQVDEAENGMDALKKIETTVYDVMFCDIKMPQMDGIDVLKELKSKGHELQIIMMSGHGSIDTAVQALKLGAYDFIEKPLDLNRILVSVRHAAEKEQLIQSTKVLKSTIKKIKGSAIIGESKAIKDILNMVDKVAPSEARVLITGSNGSGKELIARALHEGSNRSSAPFIEVNCAAIPSELIESELFGHEKGAFTSAVKDKKGKFELASGGTLFLDEIGDMTLSAQAKVLRALQENTIQRVGGEKDIKVDCRVVAATNKILRTEILEGRFREDLFHRLAVIPIHVPSLNERKDDIPLLTAHFLGLICADQGIQVKNIDAKGLKALQDVDWTGNIRELRNVLERLVILCGDVITADDVVRYANPK